MTFQDQSAFPGLSRSLNFQEKIQDFPGGVGTLQSVNVYRLKRNVYAYCSGRCHQADLCNEAELKRKRLFIATTSVHVVTNEQNQLKNLGKLRALLHLLKSSCRRDNVLSTVHDKQINSTNNNYYHLYIVFA